MRRLNANALWGRESGREVFIEDCTDSDGRMYRLEYRCTAAGECATAYVIHNPWGRGPNDLRGHLFPSGQICLGTRPFTLEEAVSRARYWTDAYSYFREHNEFPDL